MSRRAARGASCVTVAVLGVAAAFAGLVLVTAAETMAEPGYEAPWWVVPAGVALFVVAAGLLLRALVIAFGDDEDGGS